jgi:sRNA-binding protein
VLPPISYRLAVDLLAPHGALFARMRDEGVILPMAIGIREAVLARTHPDQHPLIRRAMRALVNSKTYQHALKNGVYKRHDLDGNPGAAVADDARLIARARLKQMDKKLKTTGNTHDTQPA